MKTTKVLILGLIAILLLSGFAPASEGFQTGPFAKSGSKLNITNQASGKVSVRLYGPASYTFEVKKGGNTVYVQPGKYSYQYSACGANFSGTIEVTAKGKLVISQCLNITFVNNTDGNLNINFSGPASYRLTLAKGKTKVKMAAGKYSFTVNGYCNGGPAYDEGTQKLKGGTWTWACK